MRMLLVGWESCGPCPQVLVWNQVAGGSAEYCALLVAVNSILQASYCCMAPPQTRVVAPHELLLADKRLGAAPLTSVHGILRKHARLFQGGYPP